MQKWLIWMLIELSTLLLLGSLYILVVITHPQQKN